MTSVADLAPCGFAAPAISLGPEPEQWAPRGNLESCLQALEVALAADPKSADLLFLRASSLQMLGREAESRSAYVQTLQCDPDHLGALCNLGRALIANRNHTAARMVLERAVAKHPGDLASRVALGIALYQMKEPTAAFATLERALQIAPSNPPAHAAMAFVLEALGETERAKVHRHKGFFGRSLIGLPYRGAGKPVRVLLLASTNSANAPVAHFLDDRTFHTWLVVPEFHDPKVPLPQHELVVNAIGDADAAPEALRSAHAILALTSAPVVNFPSAVIGTRRCENWRRLANIPGVVTPRAVHLARTALAADNAEATLRCYGLAFPLLLRSPGFHGGEHFVRVEDRNAMRAALDQLPGSELIAIEFLDTRSSDGKTRKYRVMMVNGELYPLHLAIGQHWKLHYFSADMVTNTEHRAADARFLSDMASVLGQRSMQVLQQIEQCLGLDYGGIDFGIDANGRIVVFEANATMIVPAPDQDTRWDYRRAAVERIDAAVRRMLLARAGATSLREPGPRGRACHVQPSRCAANELNFSAGPGALPMEVLQQVQAAVIALPQTGVSVLGMSHRSAWFKNLMDETQKNLRELLAIPESHAVLFLQGGSSLQFSMVPMNFAPEADSEPLYVRSGYWSAKAIEEARCVRPLQIVWDGASNGYRRLPSDSELFFAPACGAHAGQSAPFLHYVSNETVEGLQFQQPPRTGGIPLICDMSSDFLSRLVDVGAHAMIYAHAQKNLGPAGVTVCVIDERLMDRIPACLPPMLDYRTHLRHGSNYNTPPVFGIYVMALVTRWLRDVIGGIARMEQINRAKAALVYSTLDRLDEVLQPHADAQFRSHMNASFHFRSSSLDELFLQKAAAGGFSGLAGHRTIGGIRISLYNAVTEAAVTQLCDLLLDFAKLHG